MADPFFLVPGGPGGHTVVSAQSVSRDAMNPGLVWARYFPLWRGDLARPQRKADKGDRESNRGNTPDKILKDFVDRSNRAGSALEAELKERWERTERALKQVGKNRDQFLTVEERHLTWRFATGLGGSHPSENGFCFAVPGGFPFIPGSSVKGLCRCATMLNGMSDAESERLFGPEEIGEKKGSKISGIPSFPRHNR